jgi:hypothetical protein
MIKFKKNPIIAFAVAITTWMSGSFGNDAIQYRAIYWDDLLITCDAGGWDGTEFVTKRGPSRFVNGIVRQNTGTDFCAEGTPIIYSPPKRPVVENRRIVFTENGGTEELRLVITGRKWDGPH